MILTNAPTLESDNLILHGLQTCDIEPVINFLQDETRAEGFGHIPHRGDAWRWFATMIRHWHIMDTAISRLNQKQVKSQASPAFGIPERGPNPKSAMRSLVDTTVKASPMKQLAMHASGPTKTVVLLH